MNINKTIIEFQKINTTKRENDFVYSIKEMNDLIWESIYSSTVELLGLKKDK